MSNAMNCEVPATDGKGGESVGYLRAREWIGVVGVEAKLMNSVVPNASGISLTWSLWTCCSGSFLVASSCPSTPSQSSTT